MLIPNPSEEHRDPCIRRLAGWVPKIYYTEMVHFWKLEDLVLQMNQSSYCYLLLRMTAIRMS